MMIASERRRSVPRVFSHFCHVGVKGGRSRDRGDGGYGHIQCCVRDLHVVQECCDARKLFLFFLDGVVAACAGSMSKRTMGLCHKNSGCGENDGDACLF